MKNLFLLLFVMVFITACQPDENTNPVPNPQDSIPSPYLFSDPNFQVFPTQGAQWYIHGEYYDGWSPGDGAVWFRFTDTTEVFPEVPIVTRTILQDQFDTASALPPSEKQYFRILSKGNNKVTYYNTVTHQIESSSDVNKQFNDTVVRAYFRVDIFDNAIYQQFDFDGKKFEAKIMDFDLQVDDSIKYLKRGNNIPPPYGGNYLYYGTFTVTGRDSILFDNKWLKKITINEPDYSSNNTATIIQGARPLFFYTSWNFPGDNYTKFIYNGQQY